MNATFGDSLLIQGQRLIELNDNSILEIIGLQLLAMDPPDRAVGVDDQMSAAASAADIVHRDIERTEALLPSFRAMSDMLRDTRGRARAYLDELLPRVRAVMCDGGRLRTQFATRLEGGELVIKITAEVVAAVNGFPPIFGSLSITLAAWISKRGLDTLCR